MEDKLGMSGMYWAIGLVTLKKIFFFDREEGEKEPMCLNGWRLTVIFML